MGATSITTTVQREEILVDTTTIFNQSGVTSGPSFNIGVRQSLESTIQIDWRNNTGNIDIQLYARSKSTMDYMLMEFTDCEGVLLNKMSMTTSTGSHMVHINRKFNDIDIRFVVNSGQADIKASGIIE